MGVGEIIFEVTAYIIVAALAGLLLAVAISASNNTKNVVLRPCSQVVDLNVSVIIGDTPGVQDCQVDGQTGSYYYLGQVTSVTGTNLDYVVANFQTPPSDVCRKYCNNPSIETCEGPSIGGVTAQTLYDNCINQLVTSFKDICIPPAPMAAKGIQPYYPYAPTKKFCKNLL